MTRAAPVDDYDTVCSGATERTAVRAGQKVAPVLDRKPPHLSPQQTRLWAVLQRRPRRMWTYRTLSRASGIRESSLRHLVRIWVHAGLVASQHRTYGPQRQSYREISLAAGLESDRQARHE